MKIEPRIDQGTKDRGRAPDEKYSLFIRALIIVSSSLLLWIMLAFLLAWLMG